jgi:hypothetical protein
MRRYKIGENPDYDQIFDRKESQSDLLHPAAMPSVHSLFINRVNLLALKYELLGDEKGRFIDHWGTTLKATIPALQERLNALDAEFDAWKKQVRSEGKTLPAAMTPEKQAEKTLCEALLDVRNLELEYIQNLLDNYVEIEDKSSDEAVLKNGPAGAAQLKNSTIVMLDGQQCAVNEDGIPFINDERSRYNGMSTASYYRDIVSVWQKQRRENQKQIEKEIREGKLIREKTSRGKLLGNAPWPPLPEGTKLYNTVVKE